MKDFAYLCIIGMVLCLAAIAYSVGYQNGAISQSDQAMLSLLAGGR